MNIVQALGWFFPESIGGTEVYVAGLARRLQRSGHQVFVVAPETGISERRTYDFEGLSVCRYPIPERPSRAECQGVEPVPGTELLHQWLAEFRPDVFHCHSLVTGLGVAEIEAAKRLGARVILTCHTAALGFLCQRGTMMRWGERLCDGLAATGKCAACELQHRGLPKFLAQLGGALPLAWSRQLRPIPGRLGTALGMPAFIDSNLTMQSDLVRHVDRFVVLTEWAREAVAANAGSSPKLALNRLGIDNERFEADEAQGEKSLPESRKRKRLRLGYLGRFDRVKGVRELALAVAGLPREIDFDLEIRGPARTATEHALIAEMKQIIGDDTRARFLPSLAPKDVPSVLASYDALLCTGITVEGGPTVAFEAWAVGVPVIATRVGALAELVEDGVSGRLIPAGEPEAIATAIREVVEHPDTTIQKWRQKLPRPRTMDEIVDDYLRLYEEAAA